MCDSDVFTVYSLLVWFVCITSAVGYAPSEPIYVICIVFLMLLLVAAVCGIHCVCDIYCTCGTSYICGSGSVDGRIGDGGGVSCWLHGCHLTLSFSPSFPG